MNTKEQVEQILRDEFHQYKFQVINASNYLDRKEKEYANNDFGADFFKLVIGREYIHVGPIYYSKKKDDDKIFGVDINRFNRDLIILKINEYFRISNIKIETIDKKTKRITTMKNPEGYIVDNKLRLHGKYHGEDLEYETYKHGVLEGIAERNHDIIEHIDFYGDLKFQRTYSSFFKKGNRFGEKGLTIKFLGLIKENTNSQNIFDMVIEELNKK